MSHSISVGRPALRHISILRSNALRSSTSAWRYRSIATQAQSIASKRIFSTTELLKKDTRETFPVVPASVAPQIEQTEMVWKHEM